MAAAAAQVVEISDSHFGALAPSHPYFFLSPLLHSSRSLEAFIRWFPRDLTAMEARVALRRALERGYFHGLPSIPLTYFDARPPSRLPLSFRGP